MKAPDGMNIRDDECLALKQAIYGLVQAARQWWKTFTMFLVNELGFEESSADPCLLRRTTNKGQVLFGLYVDDCFLVGNTDAINETIEQVKDKFTITGTP